MTALQIPALLHAQELQIRPKQPVDTLAKPVDTSTVKIEILGAKSLRQFETANGQSVQTLAGNARVKQGQTILRGDSIVLNEQTGIMEVFGNVHINDADTLNTYAQYLRYVGNERIAYLKKNVKLSDGHGTLLTQDLEYNVRTGIAEYKNGGRVLSGSTNLTSDGAVYYAETKDVYFKKNVHLSDPKYNIASDSLMYNTEFKTAHFIAPTEIQSSSGNILTSNGFYNLETGEAAFFDQTILKDSTRTATGKSIAIDEKTGIVNIEGNGKVVDSVNKVILLGGQIFMDQKKNTFLGTRKPVMILYRDNDSTYITADTLFSGMRIRTDTDSIITVTNDSTTQIQNISVSDSIRFFMGFHNVKIFNDSMQAVCDSLYYSTADSVFRLFQNPIVWNGTSQITGDTMYMFTKNEQPHLIKIFNNSFIINNPDPGIFNQISGKTLDAYFINGNIDYVEIKTLAQAIHYPQNDDSAYVGMNKTSGNTLLAYFENKEMKRIKFLRDIRGVMYPMKQIPTGENKLEGFMWLDNRRPKHKLELFE